MRSLPLLVALALVACGQPEALVEVTLSASHARAAEVREVWSTRFRNARARSLLPIVSASARLEGPGLVLVATLRVPTCDASIADAMRLAVIDLTTARHRLAIHRVDIEAAEALATRLRETLGVDVRTPVELPGQLIVATPLAGIPPALLANAHTIIEPTASGATTTLWALEAKPALDGSAIATASADVDGERAAVELTFSDAGAITMTALSEAARGGFLVILVDDNFALAPRVMGRVSHSLRLELPPASALDAKSLARAIAASNLADPPTLVTSSARCLPSP